MPFLSFAARGEFGSANMVLKPGVHFWRLRGMSQGVIGTESSPVWESFVGPASAVFIKSWGTTLDVNGDGFADVLVGASDPVSFTGGAFLYLGGGGGVTPRPIEIPAQSKNGAFGESVASAGDVNGDGFGDIIVGSPIEASFLGAAYVYLGDAGGFSQAPIRLSAPGSQFGDAVASAGDVNGDGYADVLVSAAGTGRAGSAYVFLGGPNGTSRSPDALTPPVTPDGFGISVAGVGDVNGDVFEDVVVGSAAGPALLYPGNAAGVAAEPVALPRTWANPDIGAVGASAGDVNGDGFPDVVLAASGFGPADGTTYVTTLLGGIQGLSTMPAALTAPAVDGQSTSVVSSAGDVNGDGFADVVVGVYGIFGRGGNTFMYMGGLHGLDPVPVTLAAGPLGARVAVSGAGDVNGDGFAEVVVGTELPDGANVYFGGAAGLGSPTALIDPNPDGIGSSSLFGGSVASALDRAVRGPWGRPRRSWTRRRP
jgi:hypothetical protein